MKNNANKDFDILQRLFTIWDEMDADDTIINKKIGIQKTIIYAKSISKALEQNDCSDLILLLNGDSEKGIIPHPHFLPLIGEVIRRITTGIKDGRKPKNTKLEQLLIFYDICKYKEVDSLTLEKAYENVSLEYGISFDTAKNIRSKHLNNPLIPKLF